MTGPLQILLVLCALLVFSATSHAAIYKYRDKDGRLNFVDDQSKIPAEYRDRTNTITESADALGSFASPISDDAVVAPPDRPPVEPASDSAKEAEQAWQTPIVIKGNRVLVPVEVALGNRTVQLSLLLDTGATSTVLHRSSLSELDLPSGRRYKARVAGGGIVNSSRIRFRHINVGPFQIKKASAMVINLTGKEPAYDGMLGMDFLKSHPYQIDFEARVIQWAPPD